MANQEQLYILKQRVGIWNQWRKEHVDIEADLSGANPSGARLSGTDLSEALQPYLITTAFMKVSRLIDLSDIVSEGNEHSLSGLFNYCYLEIIRMLRLKRNLWKAGSVLVGMLLLLVCMVWIPVSTADAHESTSGLAILGMVTVQATPTEDVTVTALNKEKLAQEVQQLKEQNEPNFFGWLQANATLLSTLLVVIGGLVGLWRWLADRRSGREKRAEERFQSAVTGLGDEKEGPKIGAAVLLRTFLRSGYEQFYTQTFDLAVANLRLPRTTHPSEDPDGLSHSPEDLKTPLPLTTLSQALIVVFKEAFPLARKQSKGSPQSLDATDIQLDNAYLSEADLRQAWMPRAFLRAATLNEANLNEAQLNGADLSRAWLIKTSLHKTNLYEVNLYLANLAHADLSDANLKYANLSSTNLQHAKLNGADLRNVYFDRTSLRNADLRNANLSRTNLSRNDLRNADLSGAQLNGADLSDSAIEDAPSLKDVDLRKAKGLTKEQLEICKAKGAIIEEDSAIIQSQSTTPLPQSNDVQTQSATSAHEGIPIPDAGNSNAASFLRNPAS